MATACALLTAAEDDVVDRAVVPEVDDLGALALQDLLSTSIAASCPSTGSPR